MKNHDATPTAFTPREFVALHHAPEVMDRLRAYFENVSSGGHLVRVDVLAALSLAGATIGGLRDALLEGPPLALEPEEVPAPTPVKCRHSWVFSEDGKAIDPPRCQKCGARKSPQGRPKGPPTATVAGVTKQDPPSRVLPIVAREPLPPPHVEPFHTPARRGQGE